MTYLAARRPRALSLGRPDVILCMTDPPMVGALAVLLGRRYRAPVIVLSQDVFPEIAVELKRLTNPVVISLLGAITSFSLRRADRVVAIGDTMSRRLEDKGVEPRRMRVIPNWVDTAIAHAAAARQRLGARATGSPAASSSCTPATSATRRTSTT